MDRPARSRDQRRGDARAQVHQRRDGSGGRVLEEGLQDLEPDVDSGPAAGYAEAAAHHPQQHVRDC